MRKRIKKVEEQPHIHKGIINDYPIFCFKYLQDVSIKKCNDHKFFCDFIFRLRKLSELGWKEINKSSRHSFGTERLPVKSLKPDLPPIITDDVDELTVFRANGNNLPFLGIRKSGVFHIIFIETSFGDIYDHGVG
ncbi:MAG: hypothetical protein QM610_12190 [Chitinophagaceae bacterium]